MKARIDQLKLADDTALGLAFVWIFMVVDVYQRPSFGAYGAVRAFGLEVTSQELDRPIFVGPLALLLSTAFAIAAFQFYRSKTRLKVSVLNQLDVRLDVEASSIAQRFRVGGARFLCTSCLTDANAFCAPNFFRPTVIVGGGLRVLIRKDSDVARAILAHECAHLYRRDTWLLIGSWYTFLAYCLLLVPQIVLIQIEFWWAFAQALPEWLRAGGSFWAALGLNVRASFGGGSTELVSAAMLGIFLAHLVRVREYFADEMASQYGFRKPLVRCLQNLQPVRNGFIKFHPLVAERLIRVERGIGWSKIDAFFCVSAGALFSLVIDLVPGGGGSISEFSRDWDSVMNILYDHLFPRLSLFFFLFISLGFIICNHLYRTLLSRRITRASFSDAGLLTIGVWAYTSCGIVVGQLCNGYSLQLIYREIALAEASSLGTLDSAISGIFVFSLMIACLLAGTLSATYVMERMFHRLKLLRIISFVGTVLFFSFIAQVGFNVLALAVNALNIFSWIRQVSGWPMTTTPFIQGALSPVESFILIVILAITFWLCAITFLFFKKKPICGSPHINAARLLVEG